MRKRRPGEFICDCRAYKFPHRFGGGHCSGFYLISEQWETFWGSGVCETCNCLNTNEIPYCEVYNGQEGVSECPIWQEFVAYNEIKI